MAVTITTVNTGFSTGVAVTALPAIDTSLFALVDSTSSADGLSRESTYQYLGGSEEFPLSIRTGVYRNPKANNGVGSTNVSLKIANYAQKADVDDIIWTLPETWTLAKSMPGNQAFPDYTDDLEMIGTILSALFPVVSGSFTDDAISEVKFGVTNGLLGHQSS